MRYTKKEESATEGGFLIIPKFEKTLTWFDEKSRAQLYAVIGQFEIAWKEAANFDDLPSLFYPKPLGREKGCQVFEIRAIAQHYRLTLCRTPSTICWTHSWRKSAENNKTEIKLAKQLCKELCSKEETHG